ncbi:hypothetical protein [Acidocella sp.]|uniref:hypothetical protein n=1 Tax=Acidocella sp. TaxID=50710 RepID=UPI003D019492
MKYIPSPVAFPCLTFFATGRHGLGALAICMQASLFLWPTATRMAKETRARDHIERLLAELSDTYHAGKTGETNQVYPSVISKKFQQPA